MSPVELWRLVVNRRVPADQEDGEIENPGEAMREYQTMFSERSTDQEWVFHLNGRLDYQAKIRLGYGESLSVLYRHLDRLPNDFPGLDLPSFVRASDTLSFPEILQLLVDAIGLERSVGILESTPIHDEVTSKYQGESSGGTRMADNLGVNTSVTPRNILPRPHFRPLPNASSRSP